jgi:hypothetical protein
MPKQKDIVCRERERQKTDKQRACVKEKERKRERERDNELCILYLTKCYNFLQVDSG